MGHWKIGVKILFFSRGTLGQNSMFPEKGGQNSIFFPSALKKGGQNRGAYQPTSLKGCPPPKQKYMSSKQKWRIYPVEFFIIICKSDVICHGHAESYCFMNHPIDSKNYFPKFMTRNEWFLFVFIPCLVCEESMPMWTGQYWFIRWLVALCFVISKPMINYHQGNVE